MRPALSSDKLGWVLKIHFERELVMMKVAAFVGSAHKQNTHQAVVQFLKNLQALGDVESEIVTLSAYKLGTCRGCRLCFEKGEEFCPLKDDRDVLFEKIEHSDGIIFATPNYSFHMSGLMKTFIDRFGVLVHRPRFFGKAFTSIVTQGFMGGQDIVRNFELNGKLLGFNIVKGSCITGLVPYSEKDIQRMNQTLAAQSKRFYAALVRPAFPVPSWFMLIGFRMGRASIKEMLDDSSQDYRYYAQKGWLTSDYYYPTRLGPLKKAGGMLFDRMAPLIRRMIA
jgi:multimeric flavodoxin WrbA